MSVDAPTVVESKNFTVTFEFIGEGYDGDYHDLNPDDAPLYRCSVFKNDNLNETIPNGHFCTGIPANQNLPIEKLMETMTKHFEELLGRGADISLISRIASLYSWYDEKSDFTQMANPSLELLSSTGTKQ